MKQKIYLLLLLMSAVTFCNCCFGQSSFFETEGYLHSIKLNDLKASYLVVIPALNSNKVRTLNSGLTATAGKMKGQTESYLVTNAKGERLIFDSMITVINFFAFNGWDLSGKVSDFIIATEKYTEHLLFKKRK